MILGTPVILFRHLHHCRSPSTRHHFRYYLHVFALRTLLPLVPCRLGYTIVELPGTPVILLSSSCHSEYTLRSSLSMTLSSSQIFPLLLLNALSITLSSSSLLLLVDRFFNSLFDAPLVSLHSCYLDFFALLWSLVFFIATPIHSAVALLLYPGAALCLFFLSLPRITQAQLYCPESLRPSSLYALVLYLFDPSIHSSSSTSSRYPSQFKFPRCVGLLLHGSLVEDIDPPLGGIISKLLLLVVTHCRFHGVYPLTLVVVDSSTPCCASCASIAPSWRLVAFRLSILLQGSLVEDIDTRNVSILPLSRILDPPLEESSKLIFEHHAAHSNSKLEEPALHCRIYNGAITPPWWSHSTLPDTGYRLSNACSRIICF